jgi:hypothetical protein
MNRCDSDTNGYSPDERRYARCLNPAEIFLCRDFFVQERISPQIKEKGDIKNGQHSNNEKQNN